MNRQQGDSTFGERIRYYREARGMSQKELAATVGRSHPMLSAIENGKRQIHVDELVTFARALAVNPSALIGSDEADLYAKGYVAGRDQALAQVRVALDRMAVGE